jgi:hypothetical protein
MGCRWLRRRLEKGLCALIYTPRDEQNFSRFQRIGMSASWSLIIKGAMLQSSHASPVNVKGFIGCATNTMIAVEDVYNPGAM